MRGSIYDDVKFATSVDAQSITGAATGSSVDTLGVTDGVVRVRAAQASGSPSAASAVVTLQESADGSTNWSNALDNTGTVIGFTLSALQTAGAENQARIEGLGLNRKRYLRAVVTPTLTGGTSPAVVVYAELVLGGPAQQLPTNTGVSNT